MSSGDGQPLDGATKAAMEPAFGVELGGVRLHADVRASQAAGDIDALAFAHGQDIFFGRGQLRPGDLEGRKLLAHELAHVVQGTDRAGPRPSRHGATSVSRPGDQQEREADRMADEVTRGRRVGPLVGRPVPRTTLQRQDAGVPSAGSQPALAGPGAGPVDAVAAVRAAMGEADPVAGVGNFPKAFGILDGLSMHDLLWTMYALHPTGELDVLTGNLGSDAQLDVARLATAASAVRAALTAADPIPQISGFAERPPDEQAELIDFLAAASQAHEAAAIGQAVRFKPTGRNRQDVLQQMGMIQRTLAAAERDALRFDGSAGFDFVRAAVERRLQRLRVSRDPDEVTRWGAQVAAQLDIVSRAAAGMGFAADQLDAAARFATAETSVPEYLQAPLLRLGHAYAEAAKNSDLAGPGYEWLAVADRLAKTLQIDILHGTLADARRLLLEAKQLTRGQTDLVGMNEEEFRGELDQARQVIDSDPAKATEIVKHMQEHIRALHEFAIVVNSRAQFDALRDNIEEFMEKCAAQDFFVYWEELRDLRDQLKPYRDHWRALEDAYLPPQKNAQEAAWAVVRGERARLAELLNRIQAKLERVASALRITEFLFRVTILTLLALATGGVGVYLTGVAEGLGLGAGMTLLFVSAGEALFFTTATTMIFERDPSVAKFLEQFLVNWVTFGAMKGLSWWYRGVLGPAAKTLPGVAGEALLMLTSQAITSLALADHQKRKETGQGLTDAEARNIVAEGVVVGIAAMVGARVTGDLLPEVQRSGTRLGQRLASINRMRATIRARSEAIAGEQPVLAASVPGGPGGPRGPAVAEPPAAAEAKPGAKEVRPPLPEDVERVQALLEDDAALLRREGEVLEALDAEVRKNPASKEAESVRTAVAENRAAIEKNEAFQVLSVLEPVGPTEAFCQQGRLDQVAAYHRRNPDVTVTEGIDADGARTLLVTPKDPAKGQPYRVTERLTPGAESLLTKPPQAVTGAEAPPAESPYKAIGDLLTEDGRGFKDKQLDDAYKRYTQRKTRERKRVKSPEEWALSQTGGAYRKSLQAELGPDFFKQGKAKINLRDKPRPRSYGPERYLAHEAAVRPHIGKVLKAAGIDPDTGIPDGQISQGAFSGAKGVVAEVLARDPQAEVLAEFRKQYPGAVILRGLRMQLMRGGKLTAPKLFTDAVIGFFDGDNLVLLGRFEVKSGPTGGQEATVQFFEWVEGRLEPGSVLLVPGRKPVAYGPSPAQRAAGIGTVSGLANAKTFIIAPKGAEHLGLGSEMQTVTEHQRVPLDTTASEIEFLTRILLEPYIRPTAVPAAPPPAAK